MPAETLTAERAPTKAERLQAMCEYKEHFATSRLANYAVKEIRKRWNGRTMHAYQCELCGGWILGHTQESRK